MNTGMFDMTEMSADKFVAFNAGLLLVLSIASAAAIVVFLF